METIGKGISFLDWYGKEDLGTIVGYEVWYETQQGPAFLVKCFCVDEEHVFYVKASDVTGIEE